MLSDYLFYRAISPAPGGQPSESNGAKAAIYRHGNEYPIYDEWPIISSYTPNANDLDGGYVVFAEGNTSVRYRIQKMTSFEDTITEIGAIDAEENGTPVTFLMLFDTEEPEIFAMSQPDGIVLFDEEAGRTQFLDCDVIIAWGE